MQSNGKADWLFDLFTEANELRERRISAQKSALGISHEVPPVPSSVVPLGDQQRPAFLPELPIEVQLSLSIGQRGRQEYPT
jgi:hypothetical protein